MKRAIVALLLLVSLLGIVFGESLVLADTLNITNGDFEEGSVSDPFPGWIPRGGGTIERRSEGSNHYACLVSDVGNIYLDMVQPVSIKPGDRITFSFDLRIISLSEKGVPCIDFSFKNKTGTTIEEKIGYSFFEHRGEWKRYTISHVAPDNSYGVEFLLRLQFGGGEIHFDNLALNNDDNETTLKIAYGELELDRVPDGVRHIKAKLHYVPQSNTAESGNLLFAAYSGNSVTALRIEPFTATGAVYKEVLLTLPDDAADIAVKAYVWMNGQTLEPVAESVLLPREGRSAVFDRLTTERLRAAYGGSANFYKDVNGDGQKEVMEKLLDAGINAFIIRISEDSSGTNTDKNLNALQNALNEMAAFAAETDTMFFPKFAYGTDAVIPRGKYGYYHKGNNEEILNPCPLATGYWKEVIQDRTEVVARTPNVMGVVFDMEMYSSGFTRFDTPCFCNNCVNKFDAAHHSEVSQQLKSIEAESRLEYARLNNVYTDYQNWQAQEVTNIVSGIREHVHRINPNLILGMMPTYPWFDGFLEGLGTETMPALVFSEKSYRGYVESNYRIAATLENENIHALIATGLYPRNNGVYIKPADLAAKIAEGGSFHVGYWLYDMDYLEHDFTLQEGEVYEDYYPEIQKGNQQLDEALGIGEDT